MAIRTNCTKRGKYAKGFMKAQGSKMFSIHFFYEKIIKALPLKRARPNGPPGGRGNLARMNSFRRECLFILKMLATKKN